jgi:ABC-2 type transport system ATP-binding protein
MLTIRGLTKKLNGKTLLNHVNINVEEGMIYGFIGHNGAGKTTTMRSIAGITGYDSGEIIIDGKAYRNKVQVSQTVGYLPEDPSFYNYMTGSEYLNFLIGLEGRGNSSELLMLVGLDHGKNKKVATYSRGMKQRLGMAAAMIHNPKLLIMDEPTSALDPSGRYELFQLIQKLRDQGSTIILSTHILDDIEKVSDRIGIIGKGKILKEGNVDSILADYVHPIFDISLEEMPQDQSLSYLKGLDWIDSVETEGLNVVICVNDLNYGKKHMLEALVKSKLQVLGYSTRLPSLEDVFMEEIKS